MSSDVTKYPFGQSHAQLRTTHLDCQHVNPYVNVHTCVNKNQTGSFSCTNCSFYWYRVPHRCLINITPIKLRCIYRLMTTRNSKGVLLHLAFIPPKACSKLFSLFSNLTKCNLRNKADFTVFLAFYICLG